MDHGIETAEERERAGKPRVRKITLEASHQGGVVSVKVSDDGRGLNRQKVLARAIERGLVSEGERLSDELSGRGVGMDVIKTTIESLRGACSFRAPRAQEAR